MQSIIHNDPGFSFSSPLLGEIEALYRTTSEKTGGGAGRGLIPREYSHSISYIAEKFEEHGYNYDLTYKPDEHKKLDTKHLDSKTMVVCFSGGKDSLATAFHYQSLGYSIILYHITGLNKTYTSEHESARKLASWMGIPLVVEDISYKGRHDWTEHPLKNMVMAGMALNFGIQHNLAYKVAVGNFYTAYLTDNAFEVCAGDCIDMWRAWEKCIQSIIPGFKVYVPLKNYQTSYNILTKSKYFRDEILPDMQSCMTPNRFRELFKKRTEAKYNIPMLPNRCGCCWKCAVEYIWMVDHKVLRLNKPYYRHCLDVLKNTIYKENKIMYNNVSDVWDTYFFYDMPRWLQDENAI